MMRKFGRKKLFLTYLFAVFIPLLLIFEAVEAHKYTRLEEEVSLLEKKQVELVEKNRLLISEISLLSSSDRIEKIAENELGMHRAKTEDIVRVELQRK
ncbi:MAG: cell division protein FtsL [Treponema sp.]|nr:cell division protein FtsL [Treponema sp.]